MPPRPVAPTGLLFAIAAYGAWGVVPLYWRLLSSVSPVEILAHRIAWSLVFVSALAFAMGARADLLRALRDRRTRAMLAASSVLIGVNWVVFIGSIQAHRLSEASLGYFINPLVNVALGVVVFREHLRAAQRVSIALALLGVAILVASNAAFPWIALVLAASFASYGLLRKLAPVPATVVTSPPATARTRLPPRSTTYSVEVHAAHAIHEMGPKYLVIKKGEHGALLFHHGQIFYAPALPLEEVVDPTGAGDTFAGGFTGWLAKTKDYSFENMKLAVIHGSAMASFCVEAFSIDGIKDLTQEMIDARVEAFARLVHFR
jgi:RarD protein